MSLLGMVLCACTDGGSRPTASPRASASASVVTPASVCADLRLAVPYLQGMRRDTINGEALVDGLGDSAAQLKDDVRALRAAGRTALGSALDGYERALTELRGAAQALELAEGTGSRPEEEEAERDLDRGLAVLAAFRARMRGMLSGTACGGG
jgi:hypothetical protein